MKYSQLVEKTAQEVREIFPWDLAEKLEAGEVPLIVGVREADEFSFVRIEDSLHVPRGVLESACEWDYDETIPELVMARDREVIVVCRSGQRSVLAAYTIKLLGYQNPVSLKTGLRGWSDDERKLVDSNGGTVDIDAAEAFFTSVVREDQLDPNRLRR